MNRPRLESTKCLCLAARIVRFLFRSAILAVCWIALNGSVQGQTYTILDDLGNSSITNDGYDFGGSLYFQGKDGNFYGTTGEDG